jgi:23S rRNA pseudouridine1911/1915/1917 synthase
MRLDIFLQKNHPRISRAQLQYLIKKGKVLVNGVRQSKPGFIVRESDLVEDRIELGELKEIPSIELPVLYEDSDCVVINKPVGVLTHSKGAFNPESSVASWLTKRPDFEFEIGDDNERKGIVHRLDRATSGVIICAKNPLALKHLQKQFQDRKAKKLYIARVEGDINPNQAIIDIPIERNPKQPQRFRAGQNGKPAVTEYKKIQSMKNKDCLLELRPQTGRTHQLRVHLKYIKHPIIGDTFYDGRPSERLFLHAEALEITLPNKQRQTFHAEVPAAFYREEL